MASGQLGPQMIPLLGVSGLAVVPPGKLASDHTAAADSVAAAATVANFVKL